MAITASHRAINLEIIENCTRAIEKLEQQIKWEEEKHALLISGWKTRIEDCKAKISQLTAEIES